MIYHDRHDRSLGYLRIQKLLRVDENDLQKWSNMDKQWCFYVFPMFWWVIECHWPTGFNFVQVEELKQIDIIVLNAGMSPLDATSRRVDRTAQRWFGSTLFWTELLKFQQSSRRRVSIVTSNMVKKKCGCWNVPKGEFHPGMGCYFEDIQDLADGDKMLSLNVSFAIFQPFFSSHFCNHFARSWV